MKGNKMHTTARSRSQRWPLWMVGGAVVLLGSADVAPAAESMTAQQIVDNALERNAFGFENAAARLTLELISKRGNARQRDIEVRSRDEGDDAGGRFLVRFRSPADVAGTGFLVIENDSGDDDQYLYLPALGKVKRITGSQRNQKFMGTDLTYADMESRNLRDAHLKRLADASLGGNATYVIEAKPKQPEDSQYSKTITWVHKRSFVPLKFEW